VPGAAGQLLGGGRGTVKDGPDLLERDGEDVVQDKGEPLGRGQRVENDKQRETDRVGQQRMLGRIVRDGGDHRVRHVHVERVLAARRPGTQHVEADAGYDGGQPCAQIPHVAGVGAGQPQPGLLHRVVRLGKRAEHPVGHSPQVRAVRLELGCQPVRAVHCYLPPLAFVLPKTIRTGSR
jgi:hypothetical protein